MAVVFLEIGQDVHFTGGSLADAVNRGVALGYEEGYLRKSVVKDPLIRENTNDNTPAVIHTEIVDGEHVKITLTPKGFGSENMSKVYMLKPADGREGVKDKIVTAVKEAGPNACPFTPIAFLKSFFSDLRNTLRNNQRPNRSHVKRIRANDRNAIRNPAVRFRRARCKADQDALITVAKGTMFKKYLWIVFRYYNFAQFITFTKRICAYVCQG